MADLVSYHRPSKGYALPTDQPSKYSYACATEAEMGAFLAEQAEHLVLKLDTHNGKQNLVAYFKPFPIKYYNYVKRWYVKPHKEDATKWAAEDNLAAGFPRNPNHKCIMLQLYTEVPVKVAGTYFTALHTPFITAVSRQQNVIRDDQYSQDFHTRHAYDAKNYFRSDHLWGNGYNYRERGKAWIGPFKKWCPWMASSTLRLGTAKGNKPAYIPMPEKYKYYLTPEDARRGYKILIQDVKRIDGASKSTSTYYSTDTYTIDEDTSTYRASICYYAANSNSSNFGYSMWIRRFLIVSMYMGNNRRYSVYNLEKNNFLHP